MVPNTPGPYQRIEQYDWEAVLDGRPEAGAGTLRAMMDQPNGAVLLLSRTQSAYAQSFSGKQPGWLGALEREIHQSGAFRVVFANQDAEVLVLARHPAGLIRRPPGAP
jgi:hypothetical protein